MPWTKENLKEVVRDKLGEHKFIVVSNREPYIHSYSKGGMQCITPASGMTVALDPVMRACGRTWVAYGSGDADRDVVDEKDRVQVPPGNPSYTLRRVWLTKEEEQRFYYGYSNEGLWPLCHNVYVRPTFRENDWELYKKVNEKFADVVLEELGDETGFVFIQDYHFALLPRLIKERRPDVVVGQFWHIPWPNPEAFRVCPQAEDLLWGLLGNDILGFHTRYHCLNFLDSVDRFLEVRVDRERLSVFKSGRETLVRPFPISIDFEMIESLARSPEIEKRMSALKIDFRIKNRRLGVGIDRMDYTKGILERFNAIDQFFEKYPEYIGKFVFLQLGPLSRIHIPKYEECHNINFVAPTHYVPQILKALPEAIETGLAVPLVYNNGGFDAITTLELLDGVFDIYMPDFKFAAAEPAKRFCQAVDYPTIARQAIKEMHRQVGDLAIDESGIARRGLLVRHLVLPSRLAGTQEVTHFPAAEISKNTYVNIMDQYFPCGVIPPRSPLGRRITAEEFDEAIRMAQEEGLTRLDKREKLCLIWNI